MSKIEVRRCLLQDILDRRKMTQTQLSDLTGLSPTQISDYVRNKRRMSYWNAILISQTLRCHAEELYDWRIRR